MYSYNDMIYMNYFIIIIIHSTLLQGKYIKTNSSIVSLVQSKNNVIESNN